MSLQKLSAVFYDGEYGGMEEDSQGDYINYADTVEQLRALVVRWQSEAIKRGDPGMLACSFELEDILRTE